LNTPFFSVIIPTYNRAELIGDTVRSVLIQNFKNFELIVVDDGSTDNTSEIVDRINDKRLHYYKRNNEERGAARNYGIKRSKGQYVTFLDSDDALYPNHLDVARSFIDNNSFPEIFHLAYEIKTYSGKILRRINHKGDLNLNLLKGNDLSCLGVFIKAEIVKENLFNENRMLSGSEDWELWVRLACQYSFLYSNQITACLYSHQDRSEVNQVTDKLISRIELARECVVNNPKFHVKFGEYRESLSAHLDLFIALHIAVVGDKSQSIRYIFKAISHYPMIFFDKKLMVVPVKF